MRRITANLPMTAHQRSQLAQLYLFLQEHATDLDSSSSSPTKPSDAATPNDETTTSEVSQQQNEEVALAARLTPQLQLARKLKESLQAAVEQAQNASQNDNGESTHEAAKRLLSAHQADILQLVSLTEAVRFNYTLASDDKDDDKDSAYRQYDAILEQEAAEKQQELVDSRKRIRELVRQMAAEEVTAIPQPANVKKAATSAERRMQRKVQKPISTPNPATTVANKVRELVRQMAAEEGIPQPVHVKKRVSQSADGRRVSTTQATMATKTVATTKAPPPAVAGTKRKVPPVEVALPKVVPTKLVNVVPVKKKKPTAPTVSLIRKKLPLAIPQAASDSLKKQTCQVEHSMWQRKALATAGAEKGKPSGNPIVIPAAGLLPTTTKPPPPQASLPSATRPMAPSGNPIVIAPTGGVVVRHPQQKPPQPRVADLVGTSSQPRSGGVGRTTKTPPAPPPRGPPALKKDERRPL